MLFSSIIFLTDSTNFSIKFFGEPKLVLIEMFRFLFAMFLLFHQLDVRSTTKLFAVLRFPQILLKAANTWQLLLIMRVLEE